MAYKKDPLAKIEAHGKTVGEIGSLLMFGFTVGGAWWGFVNAYGTLGMGPWLSILYGGLVGFAVGWICGLPLVLLGEMSVLQKATHQTIAELREEIRILRGDTAEADNALKDPENPSAPHAVRWTVGREFAARLIADGADVNARDATGSTPLHAAVALGSVEIVEMLLTAGADLNARDANGSTPLAIAVARDYPDIISLLRARDATT